MSHANHGHSAEAPPQWFQAAMAPLATQIQNLLTRFDQHETSFHLLENRVSRLEPTVALVDRRTAIEINLQQKDMSNPVFEVVPFPDGTNPRDRNLPLLTSREAIDALTPEQVDTYYELYFPQGRVTSTNDRLDDICMAISAD